MCWRFVGVFEKLGLGFNVFMGSKEFKGIGVIKEREMGGNFVWKEVVWG